MSLSRLVAGVAAVWGMAPVWSQSSAPISLDELISQAVRNNEDVLSVQQRVEEAKGLLRQAGVRPAPVLEIGGVTGRPLGTAGEELFSAGVSQTLETAGKRSKRIEAANKQVMLAEAAYEERVRQLRFEIRSRYADYAGDSARVENLDTLIELNRRSLDLTRARVEKGDAAEVDVGLLCVELARVEAQRAIVLGRREAARADLGRLTRFASGHSWSISPKYMPPRIGMTREDLVRSALLSRPDLKTASLLEQLGESERRLAEAEGRPNATVSVAYGRVNAQFDDLFGLTSAGRTAPLRDRDDLVIAAVSIPLFTKRRSLGAIEAAVARARGARMRKEFLERAIPLEVEAALRRLESALAASATLGGPALAQAEKNLDVIRQAHQLGQMRLLDVLTEQRRLLDTQVAHIEATTEVLRGWAEVEKAVGGEIR